VTVKAQKFEKKIKEVFILLEHSFWGPVVLIKNEDSAGEEKGHDPRPGKVRSVHRSFGRRLPHS